VFAPAGTQAAPPRDRAGQAALLGIKWRIYARVMRLVSLLPSATEIVYALGLGDQLVGVTFECDEPPSAGRRRMW
jgi:ABC-type hemin transport system substrate-binding protein